MSSLYSGNIFFVTILIFLLVGCTDSDYQPIESIDFNERNGVSNVFYKLENKDTVRVAYLGGSITAQKGWRVYSLDWFKENFPQTHIEEINAAIGGTGSDFGVFRLQEHVLKYDPDLIFIEFAVNDASKSQDKIIQAMEGIIHQAWKKDASIEVCFVYTIRDSFQKKYRLDSLPNSVDAMEKVADFYQLPSINFGPEVTKRVMENTIIFKGRNAENDSIPYFSPDGVHPNPETGHKIYHEVFIKAFEVLKGRPHDRPRDHELVGPIDPDYISNAQMLPWSEVLTNSGWTSIMVEKDSTFKKFKTYFNNIGEARPGDSLTIDFKGKTIGFYDLRGPGTGTVLLKIDGKPRDTISRFDKYCTYWRISYSMIGGLRDTSHSVVFKVLDLPIDKKKILSLRENKMKKEADYQPINWYLAKILIDGILN